MSRKERLRCYIRLTPCAWRFVAALVTRNRTAFDNTAQDVEMLHRQLGH